MESTELIERVLAPQDISSVITDPWGVESRFRIQLPELRSAPRQVWGDWGPMYTVTVPEDRAITLCISTRTGETLRETVAARQIQIESPMLADERELTPLVMKLPLNRSGLSLHLFYDAEGLPKRAEIERLAVEADKPLFDVKIARKVEVSNQNSHRSGSAVVA